MSALPGDCGNELPGQDAGAGKRMWQTAQEFLAEVEAHRKAREKERLKPQKPFVPGPFVRTYQLNPHLMYEAKRKTAHGQEAHHE